MSAAPATMRRNVAGQIELDLQPLVQPQHAKDATIQQRFEAFHAANPWVFEAYLTLARDWVAEGHARVGIGMLTEVIRWQYGRSTTGDEFKINNDFRSRYVRLLVAEHPELADLFELRELRTP